MSLEGDVARRALARIGNADSADGPGLHGALLLLARYQAMQLHRVIDRRHQGRIAAGPWQGTVYRAAGARNAGASKVLGCYDQPLHKALIRLTAKGYTSVRCVGGTDPYYPICLAAAMPQATITVITADSKHEQAVSAAAVDAGVAARVRTEVGGIETALAGTPSARALLFHEAQTIRPERVAAGQSKWTRHADVILEHRRTASARPIEVLARAWKPTHDTETVIDDGTRARRGWPQWVNEWSELDRMLATWEWKTEASSWLVAERRPDSAT